MAEEIISFREAYYILSTSPRIDDRTRVLKHDDTFAVFDRFGDIEAWGTGGFGLYREDTRFLSRLTLRVEGIRPLLLSSTIKDDNGSLAVDATNPDLRVNGDRMIPRGTIHFFRSVFLWEGICYERLRIHNYGRAAVDFSFSLSFASDFADIFEVRGMKRARRGRSRTIRNGAASLSFEYEGLDGRLRRTNIVLEETPPDLQAAEARYRVSLPAGGEREYGYSVGCEGAAAPRKSSAGSPRPRGYDESVREAAAALARARSGAADVFTSNEQFNDWLNRSAVDLVMMRTDTVYGPYPYAGVPWFCTAFGRDGIITALECLSFNPEFARGVLSYLAATQAEDEDPERDAEPGKILHETRAGEMAALGEVPFGRYYGTVDATPLFVMLAGAFYECTGDLSFARALQPNVERALKWMDEYGDRDGDGFVEYGRRARQGLVQQGWKDSQDSIMHEDGALAEGPIALCEVQGYVYAAKLAAARLAEALGERGKARAFEAQAESLLARFEKSFWLEDLSTYALALDRRKRPCRVRASNAGHCLFTGIASEEHAKRTAETLAGAGFFSGWGVRTLAVGEARYNPMSYHNGSVWPHDNALIAAGFSRYGLQSEAEKILSGLLDASLFFDLHRLPELFCGFPRRPGEAPTLYPVACAPQAWAAGAVFLLLESCLGLRVEGFRKRLLFTNPSLPPSLGQIRIRNLRVGETEVDVLISRHEGGDVGVNILRRSGAVEVVVRK